MTSFVIDLRPDRVAVVCDTAAATIDPSGGKPAGTTSKVYPIATHRALIFGRGVMAVGLAAFQHALARTDLADADELAEALPGILRGAANHVSQHAALDCDWRDMMLYEAVLAGWSPAAGRFQLWQFNSYEGFATKPYGGGAGIIAMPSLGAYMPTVAGLPWHKAAIEVMQAFRRAHEAAPAAIGYVGGTVEEWRLDEMGMSQTPIWRFPDADETDQAGRETARAIGRGEERTDLNGLGRVADARLLEDHLPPSR